MSNIERAINKFVEAQKSQEAKLTALENMIKGNRVTKPVTPREGLNKWVRSRLCLKAPQGMEETTAAEGGYLVPPEYADEAIASLKNAGLARRYATIVPMAREHLKFPAITTNLSVYWPGEGTAPSASKPTIAQADLQAKKLLANVPITNELLEDTNIDLYGLLFELVANAIADEEDRVVLDGDVSGDGDAFNGILYESSTTTATMSSGNTTYASTTWDDIADMIAATEDRYLQGAMFIMHRSVLNVLRKRTDGNDRYIWTPPSASDMGTIWGIPYVTNDNMPSTSVVSQADTQFAILGNLKHVYIGDRKEMSLYVSKDTYADSDETLAVFKERIAIDIPIAAAFTVLKTAAS